MVECLPGTARASCLGSDFEMGDVADAGQCLTTEAVGGDRLKILELLQLTRRKSLTQDWQVVLVNSTAVVGDLEQLETTVLDQDF